MYGEHDLDTKVRQALSFLDEGSKVKVTVRFRGREILPILKLRANSWMSLPSKWVHVAVVESQPLMEGKNLFMMLSPNPAKKQ